MPNPSWLTGQNQQADPNNAWYLDPNNPMQYNQGYADIFNKGVSGISAGDLRSRMQGYGTQFSQMFKNMTGQDAGDQDYNNFYQNLVGSQITGGGKGVQGTNYADVQNLLSPYLQNAYGSQIGNFQQQQQQDQLTKGMKSVQDIVDQQNQNTLKNLTSPQSMAKFNQSMNQNGLLNSGVYSQQLADDLSMGALQNESAGLANFGLPQIQGMAGTANAPYQQFLGNMNGNLQNFGQGATDQYNFTRQGELAQQLQKMMQPSQMQQFAQLGNMGVGALGSIANGTSYVCMELIKRGLATEADLDALHLKIMPALLKKGRAFWTYAMDARALVVIANMYGVDWSQWRTRFLDDMLAARNAIEAVDTYAMACRDLAFAVNAEYLWDARVLRTSYWDSLPFLPMLFTYKPFVKALWKVTKLRMSFLRDIVLSEVHHA